MSRIIPIFRIFDHEKAKEFYLGFLGFKLEWEDLHEGVPVYMEVSKGDLFLHLSEHHGDCSPGAKIFFDFTGFEDFPTLKDYHRHLLEKQYKYNRPGYGKAEWNAMCMTEIDPFGNKILFSEEITGLKKKLCSFLACKEV